MQELWLLQWRRSCSTERRKARLISSNVICQAGDFLAPVFLRYTKTLNLLNGLLDKSMPFMIL